MRAMKCICGALLVVSITACGGGGGGGSDSFYGGVWDYVGSKAVDSCASGVSVVAGTVLTVNQDGNYVVVNSGNVTLTGTTNEEDGFDVTASDTTDRGCAVGYAYVFRNASDGEADAGMGLALNCGGQECTVIYAGQAVRRGGKALLQGELDSADLKELTETVAQACLTNGNSPGPVAKSGRGEDSVEQIALEAARSAFIN